mmetsp:Transcript_26922/g.77579  ORF Transcript_26922/g.77579 Transcript_26922/m.77579 type:complete len:316 (+) Transcript_26922:384-1331(+)
MFNPSAPSPDAPNTDAPGPDMPNPDMPRQESPSPEAPSPAVPNPGMPPSPAPPSPALPSPALPSPVPPSPEVPKPPAPKVEVPSLETPRFEPKQPRPKALRAAMLNPDPPKPAKLPKPVALAALAAPEILASSEATFADDPGLPNDGAGLGAKPNKDVAGVFRAEARDSADKGFEGIGACAGACAGGCAGGCASVEGLRSGGAVFPPRITGGGGSSAPPAAVSSSPAGSFSLAASRASCGMPLMPKTLTFVLWRFSMAPGTLSRSFLCDLLTCDTKPGKLWQSLPKAPTSQCGHAKCFAAWCWMSATSSFAVLPQ